MRVTAYAFRHDSVLCHLHTHNRPFSLLQTSYIREGAVTHRDVSRRFFAAAAGKIFIRRRRIGHLGDDFFAAAAVDGVEGYSSNFLLF